MATEKKLTYTITAKDDSAAGLQSFQRQVTQAQTKFAAFTGGAARGAQVSQARINSLVAAAQRMAPNFERMRAAALKAFASLRTGADHAGRSMKALTQSLTRVGGIAAGGAAAGIAALAGSLGLLGKRGFDVNVGLTKVRGALEIMLGSGRKADAVLGTLRKDAASTTFSFAELADQTKRLLAFGFSPQQARETLLGLGNAATGLAGEEGPSALLSRLTLALGQIKAKGTLGGEEALQLTEAGIPVREILRVPRGKDIGDANLSADQAIPQLLAGINAKFGGVMARGMSEIPGKISNIGDALDALSAKVTETFTKRWGRALSFVLDTLNRIAENPKITGSLSLIFDAAGRAAEWAASKLGNFFDWLSKIATEQNITTFFSNLVGLVTTVGDRLLRFLGIDLNAMMDPKNILKFFDQIGAAVSGLINSIFGLGRVWDELKIMATGTFVKLKTQISDFLTDTNRGWWRMTANMTKNFQDFGLSILRTVLTITEGINRLTIYKIPTSGLKEAIDAAQFARNATGAALRQFVSDEAQLPALRRRRDTARAGMDPRGDEPFGKRIADAFSGAGRDTSAQDEFIADLRRRAAAAGKFFFAPGGGVPAAAAAGGGGGIPVPQMGGARLPSTVRRMLDAVPQVQRTLGDPFAPVRLPDGRVMGIGAAMSAGLLPGGGGMPASGMPGGAPSVRTSSTPGGGTTINLSLTVNSRDEALRIVEQAWNAAQDRAGWGR